MGLSFRDVTNAELAILQALWECGRANIRQLTEAVYPDGTASHYATVQKLLERLERKGCVQRDRNGSVHNFTALVERDELVGHRLEAVAESLCGGSFIPLLTQLVQTRSFSDEERKALRDLVQEFESTGEDESEPEASARKRVIVNNVIK